MPCRAVLGFALSVAGAAHQRAAAAAIQQLGLLCPQSVPLSWGQMFVFIRLCGHPLLSLDDVD
eukprot:6077631-Pyramimonas_sp.AAC.1